MAVVYRKFLFATVFSEINETIEETETCEKY